MTLLVTEREADARALCAAVGLRVTRVELTPRHVICTVAADRRSPATLIARLYRAMHEADMPYYALTYGYEPDKGITEWRFGKEIA